MASCTPWRARRKAFGSRSFGSALSELVSELVCSVSMPRSRATSWTAKAPDDASASISNSQPSVLISSRAIRAASCGWPFESRMTISICRPARPPAALIFSTSIITALRDEVPSCATRPDKIVVMPILIDLLSARTTIGAAENPDGACRGAFEQAAAIQTILMSWCHRASSLGCAGDELSRRHERLGYVLLNKPLVARECRLSPVRRQLTLGARAGRRGSRNRKNRS